MQVCAQCTLLQGASYAMRVSQLYNAILPTSKPAHAAESADAASTPQQQEPSNMLSVNQSYRNTCNAYPASAASGTTMCLCGHSPMHRRNCSCCRMACTVESAEGSLQVCPHLGGVEADVGLLEALAGLAGE